MSYYRHRDVARELQAEHLARTLDGLAAEGLRTPDESGRGYAKWTAGATVVIVRVDSHGGMTLDARWVEDDGHVNGLWAPRDYDHLPWLARDVARVLDDTDAIVTLGADYRDEQQHRARVDARNTRRADTQALLNRTGGAR